MIFSNRLLSLALLPLALAVTVTTARAQEPAASPAPAVAPTPTLMDRQYDGQTHVMFAPYVWGPTINANYQFTVPRLPTRRGHGGGRIQSNVNVGPSNYLPKINSALMGAFDARRGDFDIFGDAIYINANTTASISATLSGPRGRIAIPVNFNSDVHLSTAIWELAAGFSLAHGHNADLSTFLGIREFPINLNGSYNATIGKRGLIAPSGSFATSDYTNDIIWGFRGKAYFSNDRWYVPYYLDVGQGNGNQTWQAYGGAGYVFNHGQTLVGLWRTLNYNSFPPVAHVQKMTLYGPLLGYTFNL